MGFFAVVVINDDRQAGHADGTLSVFGLDRVPKLLPESNELIRFSIDLPHHFSRRHFHLRSNRDLVAARHARRTPAGELPGPKASDHCEFERADVPWTLYHATQPFMTRLSRSDTSGDVALMAPQEPRVNEPGASMRLEGRSRRCEHSSEKQVCDRVSRPTPREWTMYDKLHPLARLWCAAICGAASASELPAADVLVLRSVARSTCFPTIQATSRALAALTRV